MILSVDPNTDPKKVGWAYFEKEKYDPGWILWHTGIGYGGFRSYPITEIIVEGQYYPRWKQMQKKRFDSIISLARHAGRWIEIADSIESGIAKAYFVEPEIWMYAVLRYKNPRRESIPMLQKRAVEAHYPEMIGRNLTEHEYAAICIGIYWITKDWKKARGI